MTTLTLYHPEPGSVPARVLDLFCRMPDEEFTSSDLALKFQVRAGFFLEALAQPLKQGLLKYDRDGTEAKHWSAGPCLKAWAAARTEAALGARGLTAPTKLPRAPHQLRPMGPSIDLLAVPIRKNVPIPEALRGGQQASRYHALWQRLDVGDCVELPDRQAAGLTAYAKKNKLGVTVRTTGAGVKSVWRTT